MRRGVGAGGWRVAAAVVIVAVLATGCSRKVVQGGSGGDLPAAERLIEHRVTAGETLALIADNYYGDPARAADIAAQNGLSAPERLTTGSVLRLQFSADEWDAARQRAAALEPYNEGVELMARERLAEAEERFRLAIATAPGLVSARYNLALVLVQRGRHDEALAILADLAEQRPEALDIRFAYGHALFSSGRFPEAAVQFRAALAVDPTHRRSIFGLGRALEEAGDTRAAIGIWQRYLELDADSSWADQARERLQKLRDAS
jgi:tetratricopeptide (TPR) repeat protein